MKTEMYVYLGISGFKCSPEQITKIIQVSPTKTFKKGDPIAGTTVTCKLNGWEYRVDARRSLKLDAIVKKVLSHFKNKRTLKNAVSKGKGSITCVLYARDRSAELWLAPATIKKIADVNCEFHLDYYLLPEK